MTGPDMASRTATRPAPWTFAAPWGARGYVTDLDGPVHWIDFGDDSGAGRDGPPIVFVHGLGGSHLNWCLIGPAPGPPCGRAGPARVRPDPGRALHVDRPAQRQAA